LPAYWPEGLSPIGDSFVGKIEELGTAAAHLDGDIAQGRPAILQPRRLAMIRTADRLQFSRGTLLEFLD
jgi:hypothetical protein